MTQPRRSDPSERRRLARIRAAFDAADYDDDHLAPILEIDGESRPRRYALPLLLRRTAGGSPLHTLVRLFILGIPVPTRDAMKAFGPASPEDWVTAGLVDLDDSSARGLLQVRYFRGLLIAYDLHDPREEALPPDYVMGVSTSTMNMASVMVRRPYESVLDLGTGSGFLALLAADHSEHVVATDLNPRAVAITRLNAGLNDIPLEALEGDLFGPVAERCFDAIVSNPPFVVAPEGSHLFLHGGRGGGDIISRRLAREAPSYLNDGGWCQFFANWLIAEAGDGSDRLRSWFEHSGCDVWVLRTRETPVDQYALTWSESGGTADDFADRFDASMDYFERSGIAAVGGGVVTMRKSSTATPWFRIDEAPDQISLPSGDEIARGFAARARIETAALDWMQARPTLRGGSELDRRMQSTREGWRPVSAILRRTTGPRYTAKLDRTALLLLGAIDGARTVGAVLEEAARGMEVPVAEIRSDALGVLELLYEQGFIDLDAS